MDKLELLKIWIDRYCSFILCKDQIKYTVFWVNGKAYQGIESFDQLSKSVFNN